MIREQIEKAAQAEVEMLLFKEIKGEEINNEHDNYEAGREDAIADYGNILFAKGAQWRINSVWHNCYEEPDERKAILAEFRFMTPDGEIVLSRKIVESLDDLCDSHCDVLNWAYLDDLMYDKEEAE